MATDGVTRRLTTILAADVVGYSRLTALDEEVALRTLEARVAAIRGLVESRAGRVFKLVGDGVLAEFASPVEAVRCALEIQEAMRAANDALPAERQMSLRIGINLGDVVVQGDDLMGDGVNIAARLESLAEPGGVCVAASVYDQIVGKMTLGADDLGPQQVKNIPRAVHAFRLRPDGSAPTPVPRPVEAARRSRWPLVAGIAAAALVAAGGAIYLALDRRSAPPAPTAAEAGARPSPGAGGGSRKSAAVDGAGGPTRAMPVRSLKGPLVPEQIPFVYDAAQREIRDRYMPAADHKALAVDTGGPGFRYVFGRGTPEDARRDALEACNRTARRQTCAIFAEGDVVVWASAAPKLPPAPLIPAERPGVRAPLVYEAIPLLSDSAREAARAYAASPPIRAMVIGPLGAVGWRSDNKSQAEAARRALEACGHGARSFCLLYALDDTVVAAVPKAARATGLLVPDDLTAVPLEDRRQIVARYLPEADWKALAVAANGRIGFSIRRDNEQDAIDVALRECARAGGVACELHAVGGFTVAKR